MLSSVSVLGLVTATNLATNQACPQVNPTVSNFHACRAHSCRGGRRHLVEGVEVSTSPAGHIPLYRSVKICGGRDRGKILRNRGQTAAIACFTARTT